MIYRIIGSIIILVISGIAYFNLTTGDNIAPTTQPIQSEDSFGNFKIN